MGDTKFTLIELHLDGETQFELGSIGTALPFGSASEEDGASGDAPEYEAETDLDLEADDEADEDGDSSSKAIGAVLALVALVAIAAAAKKISGDDEEDLEIEDEPDVVVN